MDHLGGGGDDIRLGDTPDGDSVQLVGASDQEQAGGQLSEGDGALPLEATRQEDQDGAGGDGGPQLGGLVHWPVAQGLGHGIGRVEPASGESMARQGPLDSTPPSPTLPMIEDATIGLERMLYLGALVAATAAAAFLAWVGNLPPFFFFRANRPRLCACNDTDQGPKHHRVPRVCESQDASCNCHGAVSLLRPDPAAHLL